MQMKFWYGNILFKSLVFKSPAGWIASDLNIPEPNKAQSASQALNTISEIKFPKFVSSVLILIEK